MTAAVERERAGHAWWLGAALGLLLSPAAGTPAQKAHRTAHAAHHGTGRAAKSSPTRGKRRQTGQALSTVPRWHPGLALAFRMTGKRVEKR
jgi:hypothetical protein